VLEIHGPSRPAAPSPKAALEVALSPLQRWFAAVVMHPAGVSEGVLAAPAQEAVPVTLSDLDRVVRPSARLSALERLAIYRDAYRARLVECLVDDYPAVLHALGHDAFESLCERYLDRHPSTSPSLNFFGRHFASFCRGSGDPCADFITELATLEWSMVEVLHAAPADNLSLDELSAVPLTAWESARFVPSQTVRVFQFDYPINAFYQAFRQGDAPEVPSGSRTATAVFRDGATLWRMELSPPMYQLLRSLLDGAPLGAALTTLVESGGLGEDQAPQVMVWFRDWVRHGIFGAIELG
jgi:hypothetical protein